MRYLNIVLSAIILSFAKLVIFLSQAYAEDIRDVKPPILMPFNNLLWNVLFWIASVGIILAIAYFVRKWMAKRRIKKEVILMPWEIAFKRLDEVRDLNLVADGKLKEYYSQVALIERQYVEDRFKIKAPEMTTEEFLRSLNQSKSLLPHQKDVMKNFLNSCDMVKFAKYAPNKQEAESIWQLAREFIKETKGHNDI